MVMTEQKCIHGITKSSCAMCIRKEERRRRHTSVLKTSTPSLLTVTEEEEHKEDGLLAGGTESNEKKDEESQVAGIKFFSEEKIRILEAQGNSAEEIAIELGEAGGRIRILFSSILIELKVKTIQEARDVFRASTKVITPEKEAEGLPPILTKQERQHKQQLGMTPAGVVVEIPFNRVRPMPDQPRKYFESKKLQGLANSIRRHGQRKEGEVKWLPEDPRYYCELIDGERRLRAIPMAGRSVFRALIVSVADTKEQFAYSVIANFGREGHTPLEIANSIKRLFNDGWKPIEVADVFGKSLGWVYQHVKVSRLAPEIQTWIDPSLPRKRSLKLSVALMLVTLPLKLQVDLAYEVVDKKMSVNTARHYIRKRAQEEGHIAGDPKRTPRKDYVNLKSSLRLMRERMELLLNMELSATFKNRNPADCSEVLKEVESLNRQIEDFEKKLFNV